MCLDADLMCNFQDKAKTILTAEKKLVQITGTALFPGDIAPDLPSLSGGTANRIRAGTPDRAGMQEPESGRNGKLLQSGGGLMQVKSTIKLNMPRISQLTQAAVRALELTAEALHTEVVQAQVMPFDTGHLEEDAPLWTTAGSQSGKVTLVSSTPYARRLYYHPEYNFQTKENPNARR